MNKLTIIIVWYNEEENIHKMLKYLKNLSNFTNYKVIYIDQESTDNSAKIMEKQWAEVYIHKNKWYADPDKKRAIENLCGSDDWCLILDCDEEITKEFATEIWEALSSEKYDIYNINVKILWLWGELNTCKQKRLFKKSAMTLTEDIHEYLKPNSKNIWYIKSPLINNDKKEWYHELKTMENKANIYSEKELLKLNIPYRKAIIFLFRKPFLWFWWFMIKNKQIKRWIIWIIISRHYAHYQFLIYAKYIEKLHSKNFKTYGE